MGQSELGEYADGDRPVHAEAQAVAGGESVPQAAGAGADGDAAVDRSVPTDRFEPVDETVDVAVTQVDYTVEGSGDEESPVVHIFGRTPDRELVHARVFEFRPYFYAPAASVTPERLAEYDRITGYEEAGDDDTPYESIRGDRLVKIFGQTPRDVGQLRDEFDHYEADILFPNRLLIDKDITGGVRLPARPVGSDTGAQAGEPIRRLRVHHREIEAAEASVRPRVNTFDIEVDDRSGFPEDGEEPIVCLTSHDSYRDAYVLWLYEAPAGAGSVPTDLTGYDPINEDSLSVELRSFDSEAAMLDNFLSYLETHNADIATGWNFTDFDAPYLLDRLAVLDPTTEHDLDPDRFSRVNEVWRSDWRGPSVKGRVMFDLLYAYQRTKFTELDSYRLEDVGQRELGVGKERYPGDIGDLWEDDPEQLLEYNLRDVELCVELNRDQGIVPFWNEVRQFVGCKIEDATTPGDAVDMYVLHKLHDEYVLPSKGQQESEDYEGGAVFDPITGVRENVSVLDLKSLYPMCMVTTNASPETKVDPETYDGDTYVAPNGTHFRKEPDGVIREMVDELLTEREEKKTLRSEHDPGEDEYEQYDRQQQAVKVIMNSLYGVLGWDRFRLYDREMGSAVTATGREVIEHTEEVTSKYDKKVIYGDTDSIMIGLGEDISKEEAIKQSFEFEERINESYDELAREQLNAAEHRFQIEFEKLYRRFFQAGKKKRYAGHIIWKEGKDVDNIDITGFEHQRSDVAPITKEVQQRVLEMIVTGEGTDTVKSYVHGMIQDFLDGDVALEEIGIPGGIGKRLDNYETDTAQVRGAKYANLLLGTNFGRGSKPKRVYIDRVHSQFFESIESELELDPAEDPLYGEFRRDPDVICFEYADQLPESFEVDWEKMLDKTLKGPIARILEALDISWEEVRSGQEQTGLGSFM